MPEFEPGPHHEIICQALEEVEAGLRDRLMVFAPPRHTKSEIGSKRFPAWFLGRNPSSQIITSTYAADFAKDFGRETRDIVLSPEFAQIFPHTVDNSSKAADNWRLVPVKDDAGDEHFNLVGRTKQKGVYVAVGIGGPITGRGAHLALIDDPVKNRQEADSETVREAIWKWYSSTLRTRLMPGGRIVIIMTRWHEDDLAGRLLAKQPDEWHVVDLPAINAAGNALWPAWYPLRELNRLRGVDGKNGEISQRDWQALYMQNPTPDEGTYFKREHFRLYDPRDGFPENVNYYVSTDFAVTPEEDDNDPDETVLGLWGMDVNKHLWMHPVRGSTRLKDSTARWVELLIDLFEDFDVFKFFGEKGVIRRAVEPILDIRMEAREVYCSREWITRTHDKVAMAFAARNLADMGMIHVPDNEMGHAFIDECLKFPAGKNDHQVDMFTLLGLAVNQGLAADAPIEKESSVYPADYRRRKPTKTWRTI